MKSKILCIVTAGQNSLDELRAKRLTQDLDADLTFEFVNKKISKLSEALKVWKKLRSNKWDLVYQEGTGIAGGVPLIAASFLYGQKYIISSGDPIAGFFHTTKGKAWGIVFDIYERLLYKFSEGFIGWTPYLTGVALRLGAKKAVTVEGSADTQVFFSCERQEKRKFKEKFGLNPDHLVCGVVGSLTWVGPHSYCYGLELVEMLRHLEREDASILIVGDGDGKEILEKRVPDNLKHRVVFTGRIREHEVTDAINAMDIGFVTLFGETGKFRLTTKLPEYLACNVPVAMNPMAGFFDYLGDAGWSLPHGHPADSDFHKNCGIWLDNLSQSELIMKAEATKKVMKKYFDYRVTKPKFTKFINSILF